MNFIIDFFTTKNYDVICTLIDKLIKKRYYVFCTIINENITIEIIVMIFLNYFFRIHDIFKSIISNRES